MKLVVRTGLMNLPSGLQHAGRRLKERGVSASLLLLISVATLPAAAQPEEVSGLDGSVATREHAVTLLRARVSDPKHLWHAAAVEAIMQKLAQETGGDPTQWGLAGLLHDVDLADTRSDPSNHGIIGARLLAENGFSEEVVHAVESHDDAAGVTRASPIDHALYCADRGYWAVKASGLRFPSPEAERATPASIVEGLERQGITDRIDAKLSEECARLGLTVADLLRLSLEAMRAMPEPEPGTPAGGTNAPGAEGG